MVGRGLAVRSVAVAVVALALFVVTVFTVGLFAVAVFAIAVFACRRSVCRCCLCRCSVCLPSLGLSMLYLPLLCLPAVALCRCCPDFCFSWRPTVVESKAPQQRQVQGSGRQSEKARAGCHVSTRRSCRLQFSAGEVSGGPGVARRPSHKQEDLQPATPCSAVQLRLVRPK